MAFHLLSKSNMKMLTLHSTILLLHKAIYCTKLTPWTDIIAGWHQMSRVWLQPSTTHWANNPLSSTYLSSRIWSTSSRFYRLPCSRLLTAVPTKWRSMLRIHLWTTKGVNRGATQVLRAFLSWKLWNLLFWCQRSSRALSSSKGWDLFSFFPL